MIGVIRVFTSEDPQIVNQHGEVIQRKFGIQTINRTIPDQPHGIYDEETERIAEPKIIALGEEMVTLGVKAIVVSCAADPAVQALREKVAIPVIGAGSAVSHVALSIGRPVGVLGIGEDVPAVVRSLLGDKLVGYERPEGVSKTTDLLHPAGVEKAIAATKKLLMKGAEVIVFACTGYSTIGLADVLRRELNTIVIDPVEAEGLLASYVTSC